MIAQVGGRWQVRNALQKFAIFLIFGLNYSLKVWGAVSFGPGGVDCEDRPYSAEATVYSVRNWISQNAGAECT